MLLHFGIHYCVREFTYNHIEANICLYRNLIYFVYSKPKLYHSCNQSTKGTYNTSGIFGPKGRPNQIPTIGSPHKHTHTPAPVHRKSRHTAGSHKARPLSYFQASEEWAASYAAFSLIEISPSSKPTDDP